MQNELSQKFENNGPPGGKSLPAAADALERFFNLISDLVCIISAQGLLRKVNPAWEKVLGYKSEVLVDRSLANIIHPEDVELSLHALADWNSGIARRIFLNRCRTLWGDYRWLEWTLASAADRGWWYATARDVTPVAIPDKTDQKTMEEDLKAGEEKYRALFENSIDAVLWGDPEGFGYTANPEACRMFGFDEEEFTRVRRNEIMDLSDPALEPALQERIRTGRFKGELRFKRRDGSIFPCEVSSAVFTNSKGEAHTSVIIRDITKRKRGDQALRESEERFRMLIERAPMPIAISRNGIVTYVNGRYLKLFGIEKAEEVYGRRLVEQVTPECRAEMNERARRRRQGLPVPSEYETVGLRKDGTQFPFWAAVAHINLPDGPARIAFFTDLTELNRTQLQLKESEEKYRTLFAEMVSGFALYDIVLDENGIPIDYVTIEVNREYEVLLNTSRGKVIGKRVYQSFPHLEKEWIELFGNVVLTGKPIRYLQHASNVDKWFEGAAFRISKSQFAITFVDVTERKRAEKELQASEMKFRTVADYTYDWEYWMAPDGTFNYVSPSCMRVTGYSHEEFIRNPNLIIEIIHPEDKAKTIKHIVGQHYDLTSVDFRIITRQGETRWLSHECQPIFDPEGHWIGQRASNRDITLRMNMEQELARSQEQLRHFSAHLQEAIEKEKRDLSREIHDELGQLLTGLNIDLAWLEKRLPADPETLKQKVTSMSSMIDEAEKVVKMIAADLRPIMLDNLGLAEALRWLVNQFSNRSGIKCRLKIEPENVIMDNNRSLDIYRVVQEVLTNVSRHAQATRVNINLRLANGNMLLTVKDNGVGVPPEKTGDPHSIGLIGIRERARRWRGSVEITGIAGKGTTVKLNIPVTGENDD